jgi:hypothetical protein
MGTLPAQNPRARRRFHSIENVEPARRRESPEDKGGWNDEGHPS